MADVPLSFDDIRPYNDSEIGAVLKRLLSKPSFFLMMEALFPEISRDQVVEKIQAIGSVRDFQATIISDTLERILENSSQGLTIEGLENLDPNKGYLFLSNHRDIILDSAFLNLRLLSGGFSTSYIGIGDNLMVSTLITDLMKVNKSFIIHRSAPRQQLIAYAQRLSHYIYHLIVEQSESVWLAHRNGRTKDGIDQTQASVIKMLLMTAETDLREYLSKLEIVPVAISYEYEPCDHLKAEEMIHKADNLPYTKDDKMSMLLGITAPKGRIHLAIGKSISQEIMDMPFEGRKNDWINELTALVDQHIYSLYHLWPVNYIAYDMVEEGNTFAAHYSELDKHNFEQYLDQQVEGLKGDPIKLRQHLLKIYAGPVVTSSQNKTHPHIGDRQQ